MSARDLKNGFIWQWTQVLSIRWNQLLKCYIVAYYASPQYPVVRSFKALKSAIRFADLYV